MKVSPEDLHLINGVLAYGPVEPDGRPHKVLIISISLVYNMT
jgi:hypothetical protein